MHKQEFSRVCITLRSGRFVDLFNERAFYYNHIFASCNHHLATDGSSCIFLLKQNRTTRYVFIIEVHCFGFLLFLNVMAFFVLPVPFTVNLTQLSM